MVKHTVQQGECLASIGKKYGMPWRTIWNHPKNAELKGNRKDPNVLYPGDILYVPDREEKQENGATEERHRFQLKETSTKFRLRLFREGQPRDQMPYVLEIDGQLFSGKTNDEGWLEHRIPPDAQRGRLVLNQGVEEYSLRLGHLDPVGKIRGAQQRLKNLGFYGGEIDGIMGPQTQAAIAHFQRSQGLRQTEKIDQPTSNALKDYHKS